MNMKRVLIVFPGIKIKNDEGSKHRLNCHINEYKKRGYEVDVLAFCRDVNFSCESKYLNPNANWIIRPYAIPLGWNLFLAKLSLIYFGLIIAFHTWIKKYTVVQMELFWCKSILSSRTPIYITDVHGDLVYELKETGRAKPWFTNFFVKVQKRIIDKSDICVVVSENLKHQLEKNTGSNVKDYSIISCAVNVEMFNNASKASIDGIDLSNRIVLGYCGGFHGWQNFDEMIKVATRLHKLDKRIFLLAFSNSDVKPYMGLLEDLGEKNYYIKGLAPSEVPSYLKLMDAGLLLRSNLVLNIVSSPTKICEYLAAGVPLICTQYSGDYKRCVVNGVNGFVGEDPHFSDKEVELLLEWLKGVKNDRQKVAERCIDSVRDRSFSAEFDGLENLIDSLLGNK